MQQHFLPNFVGISMTKSQFCFCTGLSPYKLRCRLTKDAAKYAKLGVTKYDKMLMPNAVMQLLADTGLRINLDLFTQYVAGQRGIKSPVLTSIH